MRITLREQLLAAIFAGIISILSQVTIPFGLIPLTLQTFIIGLTVTILGTKTGTWAITIYLILGLIGIPVFAGGSAGFGVLFGPTGGFLI
ncbi:MAG: biotin transporter BioY, partial [Enterococcus sp.]